MTRTDVIKQQQIVMPKIEELCSMPIATSREEAASWQNDHILLLLKKEEKVKNIPEQLYDEVDNMFAGSQGFYTHMVTSWFDNNFANVRSAQLRLKEKNGDMSRAQRLEAFDKIQSADVSKIDNTKKMRFFFEFFETLLVKIQNRGDWLSLLKKSSLGMLSDRLVWNIEVLDLFAWQLPNADSRHINNYHQIGNMMVIFFFIEQIYKNDCRLSDHIDPFEELPALKKILAYYDFQISPEERYKNYKLRGLLDSKSAYLARHPGQAILGTIAETFRSQFMILENNYNYYAKKYAEIQKIKSKYTKKRAEDFGSIVDFYDWYKKQSQTCGYCGITQDELKELFAEKNRTLPLNSKKKRASGTLEIERRNSASNTYDASNMILACPLCNNAKSNLIDEESWKSLFVSPMRRYYEKLLGRKLSSLP